ncbi:MAG: hypothetical protein GY834_10775, partial [Bacteroidetes bacterium]|nr:hypothetical protein [Bacteroidota bacterium]
MVNPVKKGKDGEREAAKWLACNLKLAKTPERILEQPRSGGFDLLVPPFAIEVKRDQVLTLRSWWVKLLA